MQIIERQRESQKAHPDFKASLLNKALLYRQLHFTAPLPPPGFVHWRITEGTGGAIVSLCVLENSKIFVITLLY